MVKHCFIYFVGILDICARGFGYILIFVTGLDGDN